MSKTHLIKDEQLGGELRESVKVDRKAEVEDYVYFTSAELDECRSVLEPLLSPEELSQPNDQLDIIARLTRKVAQLERDIERLERKQADNRLDIETVLEDIATLDDRTQPEEMAKKIIEAITKGLNAIESR